MALAHKLDGVPRTTDVQLSQDITFESMLVSDHTYKGLKMSGFYKPSPVQLKGVPMGKCGFDLLLEAKSGTGKTAVFTIIALDMLDLHNGTQVLILAPTREIASQIATVIRQIGIALKGLVVEVFIGGLSTKEDIKKLTTNKHVHVVVGSPGRLRHLIQDNIIDVSSVRLLVIDEADKLMEDSFQADINYIYSKLPERKQVIASSATFNNTLREFVGKYMKKPCHICPDSTSVLLGITQKITIVDEVLNVTKQSRLKYTELIKIFKTLQFKQCLIFCNYQARVRELSHMLKKDKWPVETLHGGQEQLDRLDALKTLQDFKCRILIATDLAARGIDASNVDLVINFEAPYEWATYLHRIGRAGRYGSYGTAISIVVEGKELKKFKEIIRNIGSEVQICDLWTNKLLHDLKESNEDKPLPIENSVNITTCKESNISLLKLISNENNNTDTNIEDFNDLIESYTSTETKLQSFDELITSYEKEVDNNSNIGFKSMKISFADKKEAEKLLNSSEKNDLTFEKADDKKSIDVEKCEIPKKQQNKKTKNVWLRPYHKEYYENQDDKSVTQNASNPNSKSNDNYNHGKDENLVNKEYYKNRNLSNESHNKHERNGESFYCCDDNGDYCDENVDNYGDDGHYYGEDGHYYGEDGHYYGEDGHYYGEDDHYYGEECYYYNENGDYYEENGDYYEENGDYQDANNDYYYCDRNHSSENTCQNGKQKLKKSESFSTKNNGEVKLSDIKTFKRITKSQNDVRDNDISKAQSKSLGKPLKTYEYDNSYKLWKDQLRLSTFQFQYAIYVREMSKKNV